MTKLNFKLFEHYLVNAAHNNDFYDAHSAIESFRPRIELRGHAGDKSATFYFFLSRNDETHQLAAVTPQGGTLLNENNIDTARRLDIPLADFWAVMEELRALADDCLKYERTEEDKAAEAIEGYKFDIFSTYELDQHGARYDGDEFDPEDDFHKWLIENEFAWVDDAEDAEKTLRLYGDWRDRLSDYFARYFLDITVANNGEGTALCVDALITTGGPHVAIEQFMGRGYTLRYSWGAATEVYSFDRDLDQWLDEMFGVWYGDY